MNSTFKENYLNINNYHKIAMKYNYEIFSADYKDYNINIWGIRNKERKAGKFDDLMVLFWKYNGVWTQEVFTITTDPSDISLINMKNPLGTGIIKEGQYKGLWKKGLHKGDVSHPALVQAKPVTVIRDFNKDGFLNIPNVKDIRPDRINTYQIQGGIVKDYIVNNIVVYREHTLNGGFNCHRASKYQLLQSVGLYSEGCQVHQSYSRFMSEFLPTIDEAIRSWGNSFSYTLVNEERFYE